MLARNNDLYNTGTSAEDQMKQNSVRQESEEVYQKNLYREAARRVVFANCMNSCELDAKQIPNFNRDFYYNQTEAQSCLQDCYNTRIKLHFGSVAEKEGLLMDFQKMKREFQRYEKWSPEQRNFKEFAKTHTDEYVDSIAQSLIKKTQNTRFGKYDFQ